LKVKDHEAAESFTNYLSAALSGCAPQVAAARALAPSIRRLDDDLLSAFAQHAPPATEARHQCQT